MCKKLQGDIYEIIEDAFDGIIDSMLDMISEVSLEDKLNGERTNRIRF